MAADRHSEISEDFDDENIISRRDTEITEFFYIFLCVLCASARAVFEIKERRSIMIPRLILATILLLFAGCDQQPEEVYVPPVFSGTAYVLGDGDHIAVLDLGSARLRRLKVEQTVVDLALTGDRLYALGQDGTLLRLDRETGRAESLDRPVQQGMAMATDRDGSLWILGKKEICQYTPARGIEKRFPLPAPATSLFFDQDSSRLMLIDRPASTITVFDPATLKTEKTIRPVGNSVHHGVAFPGHNELWVAEGNEFMDGEPYGIGYAKDHPAMPGGINVIDTSTGRQTDFIIVGGNTVDITFDPAGEKAYAVVSRLPEYIEATLSVVDTGQRRVRAEFRLCDACHAEEGVELENRDAEVRAMVIDWQQTGGRKASP